MLWNQAACDEVGDHAFVAGVDRLGQRDVVVGCMLTVEVPLKEIVYFNPHTQGFTQGVVVVH